ncbi:MAG: 50S ribosomal protein L22 [Acidimicrobiaceae bacterium]|nr:50S ribosomal protein L22 [Acidimicrobiaceae bacterium]|tara:strand:- start:5008 stop:5667 length:660 start_codon:yes stop_codon:yes gene_type:complete
MSGLIDLDTVAGARSIHKFARLSASKARVVLDLIRDADLEQAREELQFCDRAAATVISKVLESAVSNAENNENLSADELYVAECWADEGPTLKRWRPRARGRATRINKRTCHITVVVAQLSDDELEMRATRLAASGRRSADQDRAARVAASKETEEEVVEAEIPEDGTTDDNSAETELVNEEADSSETETADEEQTETENAELEPTEDADPTDEEEKEA